MPERSDLLPAVEIEPRGEASASVIWLHGLGADGHDFEPIVPHLGLSPEMGVRFVFPHAPAIPVTINAGMVMPAWFDVRILDLKREHDERGIRASLARVEALLDREIERGIAPGRIVMAGFSQGGAIALHAALRRSERLAGLLLLSTYLVLPESFPGEMHEANRDLPVFQAHGTYDPLVLLARGEDCRDRLREAGYKVEWTTYPIQHEVSMDEIQAVGAWLRERLA